MPLTPKDIIDKNFREAFRGYNQADVDLFLDEVVEEYTRITEENQKMKVRLAALQQEIARLREGRGAPAGSQVGVSEPDPARVDSEVRARLRRVLEEQLRALESGSPVSSTVERLTRDLPTAPPPERPAYPLGPAQEERPKPPAQPEPQPAADDRPFWAGE